MSLAKTKTSSALRGAHLSKEEIRDIALGLGTLLDKSTRDNEGRIHLNPIVTELERRLGAPCVLYTFVEQRRSAFEKIANFYGKEIDQIYKAKGGRYNAGTW
jgi:hypothetical protein